MGYHIENYDLHELQRIALPGAVSPTLFWVLPIGSWPSHTLEELWWHFTKSNSLCKDLGLLLVKADEWLNRNAADAGISIGAKLAELLHPGALASAGTRDSGGNAPRLLVLAGSYPQPGWGILLDGAELDDHGLERILEQILERALRSCDGAVQESFEWAKDCARERSDIEEGGAGGENLTQRQKNHRAQDICEVAEDLAQSLREGNAANCFGLLNKLKSKSHAAAWLALPNGLFQDWETILQRMQQGQASDVDADAGRFQAELRSLSSWVQDEIVNGFQGAAHAWDKAFPRYQGWREKVLRTRENYHKALVAAHEMQWKQGPRFLIALEHALRDRGISSRNIPWDPARMVGWKIVLTDALAVAIRHHDLIRAARQVLGDVPHALPEGVPGQAIDGGDFTDYVHYIALSKPGTAPRKVMQELLANLLSPDAIRRLIRYCAAKGPKSLDGNASDLAGELLGALGWAQRGERRVQPLAACLGQGAEAIDARMALESLAKDLVRVVVAELGYDEREFLSEIHRAIPTYSAQEHGRNWEYEVAKLTPESAVKLLGAFGPLAFPDKDKCWSKLCAELRQLARNLNALCHHDETQDDELPFVGADGPDWHRQIERILDAAEEILGELPWHLEIAQTHSQQPRILSGEAWSHGHPTPRLLHVLAWTPSIVSGPDPKPIRTFAPGMHLTIWDKTRRAPLITDPIFIAASPDETA